MKKKILMVILTAVYSLSLSAQSVDDVRELFESGEYGNAYEMAGQLVTSNPNDGAANYWYGRTAYVLGHEDEATKALTKAVEKGYVDAYADLLDHYMSLYNVTKSRKLLSDWKSALSRAKRPVPEEVEALDGNLLRMTNQLARVEDVPVFARFEISRKDFNEALAKLNSIDTPKGPIYIGDTPFYINNTYRELFWTAPDDEGVNRLYMAGILDDGTLEEPVSLTEFVGDGDIMAPYLMDDGETLYFAAKKPDGIGGYDIYMTRRNGEGGFFEPSNIGMPYNSARDELMYVVDENNNIGWWISNRSSNPEVLSVFVFVPNKSRINLSPDAEDLLDHVILKDIGVTLPRDFDTQKAKKNLPKPLEVKEKNNTGTAFELSLGNGRVITAMNQFKSRDAATAMSEVLRAKQIVTDNIERLDAMRSSFAHGETNLKSDIVKLEAEVDKQQADLKTKLNRVIRLENSAK